MKSKCPICPHRCTLVPEETGLCGARKNADGKIVCDSYGKISAAALDPIEKKPLRRFFPGMLIFSVGSYGCNLNCPFCQNHRIAKPLDKLNLTNVPPDALVQKALSFKEQGNIGIAYTYNEPLIGYEYVMDCAQLAHSHGLKNVLVTNGYIEKAPLSKLLPFIDAINIDLKSFNSEFYKKLGGDIETVKNTILLAASEVHIEVTNLIIHDENDSPSEMENLASWLSDISTEIPLHVSRFFPCYKYSDKAQTPVETVYALADIARKHLSYVYTGNC